MRFLAPSMDDILIWDRCFKRYPGATATGPLADGALTAAIPYQTADYVKLPGETASFDDMTLETDDQSDKLQIFKFAFKGYKFETCFRGPVKWFTICNVQFLKDDDTLRVISSETYLDCAVTSSIEEICLLLNKLMGQEWSFIPTRQIDMSNRVTN
jgi:hypothetical protein